VTTLAAPNVGFLLRHPAHFIALGFGLGLAPVAPGTFGTLLGIPLAALLRAYLSDAAFGAAIVALFVVGIWAAEVAGRNLGAADHGAIVWDEVVAFLAVLFFVGPDPVSITAAFVVFRIFDIVKPPPIRQLERAFKNGFGVMADDLLAAGYALVVLAFVHRIFGEGPMQ
jgi:phosphatidylglycerophosphatase A